MVNLYLKLGGYIYKPKRYYSILKIAISSLEYYLLLIPFLNTDLVVRFFKVKYSKDLRLR